MKEDAEVIEYKMEGKKCLKCKKIIIKDFEKWKKENPTKVFHYCPYCRRFVPVMRSEGVDV